MAEFLADPLLEAVPHGFFTRRGGVSSGAFASLNCSLSGRDDLEAVMENRTRAAAAIGLPVAALTALHQVHGPDVAVVDTPWPDTARPRADAMVTARPGVGLAIVTADCAPVLFADRAAGVVGAAHAGWRGALAGVAQATIAAMVPAGAVASSWSSLSGWLLRYSSAKWRTKPANSTCSGCARSRRARPSTFSTMPFMRRVCW